MTTLLCPEFEAAFSSFRAGLMYLMSEKGGGSGEFSLRVCTVMGEVAIFQVPFLVVPQKCSMASFEVAIGNCAGALCAVF